MSSSPPHAPGPFPLPRVDDAGWPAPAGAPLPLPVWFGPPAEITPPSSAAAAGLEPDGLSLPTLPTLPKFSGTTFLSGYALLSGRH